MFSKICLFKIIPSNKKLYLNKKIKKCKVSLIFIYYSEKFILKF